MALVTCTVLLLAPALLFASASAEYEYRPSACEACEIALEEGYNHVVAQVKANKGSRKPINFAYTFPKLLRQDMNVWRYYSKVHMTNLETHYLGNKVADHWKSIEIKFVEQYGAKDFDRKSLAQAQKGVGQIRRADLHTLWYKECVQLSGYCKDSTLREPEYPLTQCGACRTVVRDLMIDIRRKADTPHKAKIGLVEEIFADVCDRVPQRHPPTRAKILQKVCEETLQEEHGDDISITVHKALAAGPGSWAALGRIEEYSRTWTRQMEQRVCTEDVASCNWDENDREEL